LVSFSFSKNWVFVTNEFFQKQKEKQKEKKCVLLKKYKKNNIQETQVANATTLGPSFLFFNYYILNTILLKKQQRIYCFLNFNFVFYNVLSNIFLFLNPHQKREENKEITFFFFSICSF